MLPAVHGVCRKADSTFPLPIPPSAPLRLCARLPHPHLDPESLPQRARWRFRAGLGERVNAQIPAFWGD